MEAIPILLQAMAILGELNAAKVVEACSFARRLKMKLENRN